MNPIDSFMRGSIFTQTSRGDAEARRNEVWISGSASSRLRGPCDQPMHIVLVLVTVRPEWLDEFERALLHNARESTKKDPGCLRFDVSQHLDDPTRWVLYEVYDSPDAHAAHRRSPHFLAYDAVASRALVDKTVIRASGKYIA